MNNDINRTQKLRHLGQMSADEFFADGGGAMPIQDLPKVSLEGVPADVIDLANKMILDEKASPISSGGGRPHPSTQQKKSSIHDVHIDGNLDVDLFQLAVGKDIIANIDSTITQYEESIDHLHKCKHKLCKLLNITEKEDGKRKRSEIDG